MAIPQQVESVDVDEADHNASGSRLTRTMRGRRLRVAAIAVAFFVAVIFYYAIARRLGGGNSDVATPLLQGQAMAHGHLTLNGWNFIHDSFWTVDVLFYTVGYLVLGIDPRLMFIVPAIVAATIMGVAAKLAMSGVRGRTRWVGVAVLVVAIGLPTQGWTFLFLSIYGHPATILYALVAFAALLGPFRAWRWALAVGMLTLGLLGDLQILPLAVGPIFGAGVVAMMRTRSRGAGLPLIAAATAAPVCSFLVRRVAEFLGTYGIAESNPTATPAQMRSNVSELPTFLNWAFGSGTGLSETVAYNPAHSGLWGRLVQDGEVRVVVASVVTMAVMVAVSRTTFSALVGSNRPVARAKRPSGHQPWRLDDLLAIACVGDIVFFTVATLADDAAYTRYVASFVVFGGILAARLVAGIVSSERLVSVRVPLLAVGAVLALVMATASATALSRPEQPFTNKAVTDFIASKGLSRGVGMFWDANQSTVASGGDVLIRPVLGTPDGFVPREQLAMDTWFREPFEFVLCANEPAFEGVSCELAEREFGKPAKSYSLGDRSVLVWSEPIVIGP